MAEETDKVEQTFKGSLFSSGGIILRCLLMAFFIFFLLTGKIGLGLGEGFLALCFISGAYLISCNQTHYFQLTSNMLVVRNHCFPPYRKDYLLADITTATIQSQFKAPLGLELSFVNSGKIIFYADTLGEIAWTALMKALAAKGIKVTDTRMI